MTDYTLILWHGPNGFRRYCLCEKCVNEVDLEKKSTYKPREQSGIVS